MTRKDMLCYFNVGETLVCMAHWRSPAMIGKRRVVRKIGRNTVEFAADVTHPLHGDYTTPSDLCFPDITSIERYDGQIHITWAVDRTVYAYVSYQVVE